MINVSSNKSKRDQKIEPLKERLPESLLQIRKLIEKNLSFRQTSGYCWNDLRKTIFDKLHLYFVDFAVHVEFVLEEEYLKNIVSGWRQYNINNERLNINADYLENFLSFSMRSLYSDSIELAEHLIATILESLDKKNETYMKFPSRLELLKKEGFLCSEDAKFLRHWMNKQRHPRHRNFEDYHEGGKSVTYSFPHDFSNFEQLLDIIQKIATHSLNKEISFVEDKNPR